jgi:hypothetical protein
MVARRVGKLPYALDIFRSSKIWRSGLRLKSMIPDNLCCPERAHTISTIISDALLIFLFLYYMAFKPLLLAIFVAAAVE